MIDTNVLRMDISDTRGGSLISFLKQNSDKGLGSVLQTKLEKITRNDQSEECKKLLMFWRFYLKAISNDRFSQG